MTSSSRTVGDAVVTVHPIWTSSPSGWLPGWLLAVGPDDLYVSDDEADALLMLLLTRMYKVSEADVEIALTTLSSLQEAC